MSSEVGKTLEEIIKVRREKLKKIQASGRNPYPSKSCKEYLCSRVHSISEELIASGQDICVAGRICAIRGHGKLMFCDIVDQSGKLQVLLKQDNLGDDFGLMKLIDLGDFFEVEGNIFLTKSGEISIQAKYIRILSKALRPLPSKLGDLKDDEFRFRHRYLDLLLHPQTREMFELKAKFWQSIRNFLLERNFLEVETPVLETTTGGADADPFVTHHNSLDMDVYLRISMGELWQKRLLIGGFEKTFEIGRQFRNEGISREHLQDYSQMEFYWAYADYNDSMKLVENMYKKVAKEVFGKTKFEISGHKFDLAEKWQTIKYCEALKEKLDIDILKIDEEGLKKKIIDLKLEYKKSDTKGRMIDTLWKFIRKSYSGPAFLIDHPVEVSPLAKRKEDNPKLVERFQVILAGSEIGNGYSELNDPIDQRERFIKQAKMRERGDKEAQMNDEEFVKALEYGMPPATGFGTSERMFAFLLGKSVRECVLFPLIKPKEAKVIRDKKQELE